MRRTAFSTSCRVLSAIAIAVLVAACGGGDDDGGGGGANGGGGSSTDDPAPPMPTTVNFSMGTKDSARLAFSADGITIAYPALQFSGTWNRTANTWTLRGSTGVDSGVQLFGAFSVQTIDPMQFSGDDSPTAGKLEFSTPAGNSYFPGQRVQATYGANVLVTYNQLSNTYDWETFIDIWADATQSEPDRLASFGTTASGLVVDRAQMVLDLMATINANDLKIASAAGFETACSPRPGAPTGTRRIALANQDGELNPGDTIVVTYTNCWIDDANDNVDLLLNGSMTMSNYIENASPFSTGFGEIAFNNLSEHETETIGSAVNVIEPAIVTTGTMTLFVQP